MSQGTILHAVRSIELRTVFGFGFFFAWSQLLIAMTFPFSSGRVISPILVFCLAPWVLAIFLALKNRDPAQTNATCKLVWLMAAAWIAASGATFLVSAFGSASEIVSSFAALVSGTASAVGFGLYARILMRLERINSLGTVLASIAVFGIIDWLMGFVPADMVGLAAACIGLVSLALFWLIQRGSSGESSAWMGSTAGSEAKPTPKKRSFGRFSVAYLVYAFVFGITFGVSAYSETASVPLFISYFAPYCIIGGIAFLVVFILCSGTFSLKSIGQIISPLLVVFYLVHLLFQGEYSSSLVNITFALWWIVQVFALLTLIEIVRQRYADKPLAFATGWALFMTGLAAGVLFGQGLTFLLGDESWVSNSITAFSAVAVVVATSLLIGANTPFDDQTLARGYSEADRTASQELSRLVDAESEPMTASTEDAVVSICEAIAGKHGLTSREGEVLLLLAQGNTRNGIAKKLVVSDNTVRAHVKSIYTKLHIHSKQELVDIIDKKRP